MAKKKLPKRGQRATKNAKTKSKRYSKKKN